LRTGRLQYRVASEGHVIIGRILSMKQKFLKAGMKDLDAIFIATPSVFHANTQLQ
jgi:hypothetical protein